MGTVSTTSTCFDPIFINMPLTIMLLFSARFAMVCSCYVPVLCTHGCPDGKQGGAFACCGFCTHITKIILFDFLLLQSYFQFEKAICFPVKIIWTPMYVPLCCYVVLFACWFCLSQVYFNYLAVVVNFTLYMCIHHSVTIAG